ncbi:hypothetical protein DVH05_023696 [Phytophthora capsici]|nr:hypothetical protein DVH05_023696 [Phytophthora capsici]
MADMTKTVEYTSFIWSPWWMLMELSSATNNAQPTYTAQFKASYARRSESGYH